MSWYCDLDERVAELLPKMTYLHDEPLSQHTSFRVGGPARRMALPETEEDLIALYGLALQCGAKPLVLGNGTNVLFSDEGVDRLVIGTSALCTLEKTDACTLKAGAGLSLARLAVFAQQNGLTGLEFAHGIPGSAGGAVCMNAGAYGGEMKDVLLGAQVLFPDGTVRFMETPELTLSYRHSYLTDHPDAVVLHAAYRLQKGDCDEIRSKMDELMAKRKASQPLEYPSAGSTFKRPEGHFAGALIEQAGLKGFSVGDAQVSEKHAGFVINRGHATAADILELIRQVQQRVLDHSGVLLEPEVRIFK